MAPLALAALLAAAAPAHAMNRLAREKSPYLLQHAGNPVDWFPWGPEAFEKARAEGKPVFLSIGYATCHWCHVMEEETFEDPKAAAVLNASFIPVKVDREERPDVDRLYMTAAGAAGWGGGWPLNLFLTPDLKPFYGGTYFPPEPRWGRPSFIQVASRVAELWGKDRAALEADAGKLAKAVSEHAEAPSERARPVPGWPGALVAELKEGFDAENGGFGGAPKFPMPPTLAFLLAENARTGDKAALEMSAKTLSAMGRGGVYDQLGGGFHRYSVDAAWRVPHFEKMLYDQAQLAPLLLDAHLASRDADLTRLARETLDAMIRDLGRPEGGFFSAEDADSVPAEAAASSAPRRAEGAFYLWTEAELKAALGADADLFAFRYGVEPSGNAPDDPHGEFAGRNILYAAHGVAECAARFKTTQGDVRRRLESARATLLALRGKRPRPRRDEKIVTAWNGLALSALARGAQVLEDPRYLAAAEKTAAFIRTTLWDSSAKRLKRRWADGEAAVDGVSEDYAFLARGLIDLYEASFDPAWLEWAVEVQQALEDRHGDGGGRYRHAARDAGAELFARFSDDNDGAEPAAASVAATSLLRLSQLTERPEWRAKAEKVLEAHGGLLREAPRAMPLLMAAWARAQEKPRQVVLAGSLSDPAMREFLRLVHSKLRPPLALAVVEPGPRRDRLVKLNPLLRGMGPVKGKPTAYICVNFACELPTSDLETARRLLDKETP